MHYPGYLFQLLHKVLLVVETSCGIADNYIGISCLGSCQCIEYYRRRVRTLLVLDKLNACTVCPYLQLIYSCGTESICSRHDNVLALIFQLICQLAYGCGLAYAVNADNKYNRRNCGHIQRLFLAQHLCDNVFQYILYLCGVGDTLLLNVVTHLVAYLHRGIYTYIGKDKCFFQFFKQILVYLCKCMEQSFYPAHH